MNTKIISLIVGILSFSYSFSQTVEQDFSHLDKNKDGKIDKSEFQNPPPPPPVAKQRVNGVNDASPAPPKSESSDRNTEDRAVKKEEVFHAEKMDHPTFESIDTNGDGIIDMNEFKLNHTVVRKRPGATRSEN